MPLLPRPPDAISTRWKGSGTESIRIAIRRIKSLLTTSIHRWCCMADYRLSMNRRNIQQSKIGEYEEKDNDRQHRQTSPTTTTTHLLIEANSRPESWKRHRNNLSVSLRKDDIRRLPSPPNSGNLWCPLRISASKLNGVMVYHVVLVRAYHYL